MAIYQGDKQISNNYNIDASVYSIPVGVIVPFSGSDLPTGFLLCNGQAVSKTNYADLYKVVGNLYGESGSEDTFLLPDLRDKFVQGANENLGANKEAGLPNITGKFYHDPNVVKTLEGSFSYTKGTDINLANDTANSNSGYVTFDASKSNSIYGNSDTVQPPAICINYIIKATKQSDVRIDTSTIIDDINIATDKTYSSNKIKSELDSIENNSVGKKYVDSNGNSLGEIFNDYSDNVASAPFSHAEGQRNTTSGYSAHAEGIGNTATGAMSHVEGNGNTVSGNLAHAEGTGNTATGVLSHVEGMNNKTLEKATHSHVEGSSNTVNAIYAHAEGYDNTIEEAAQYGHVEGTHNKLKASNTHVEGWNNTSNGQYSHVEGYYCVTNELSSHAEGWYTIANQIQHVSGRYNIDTPGPTSADSDMTGSLFVIGNGIYDSTYKTTRSNAFRIGTDGSVYGQSAYNSTGADYAEYFEWKDGNSNDEDRRGLFVTLDGDKIKLTESDSDYILGVVSSTPLVLGDAQSEEWNGKYKKDVFGSIVTENRIEHNDETNEDVEVLAYVLNPDYNPDKEYISRENRKEWATIGLIGKLILIDDGTCEVNGYCKAATGGIATKSDTGYRVMKRIDDTHIQIIFK